MHVTADTPREPREYSRIPVSCPAPYAPGHTLSAPEASFMNTYVGSAVGNRWAAAIKTATTAATTEANPNPTEADILKIAGYDSFQAWFDETYADFEPGVARRAPNGSGTSTRSDPVTSLARSFAEIDLIAKVELKFGKGGVAKARKTPKEDGRTVFTHWLDAQFEKGKEDYLDRAREQMAEAQSLATEDDFELEMD